MEFMIVAQTIAHIHDKKLELTEKEKEFVAQFALRSADGELTYKLLEELMQPGADRQRVCRKFEVMAELPTEWIQKLEELFIALLMYRIQQERAVKLLESLIPVCQASITKERINHTAMEKEESEKQEVEHRDMEKGETYVGGNTTGSTDYPSRL